MNNISDVMQTAMPTTVKEYCQSLIDTDQTCTKELIDYCVGEEYNLFTWCLNHTIGMTSDDRVFCDADHGGGENRDSWNFKSRSFTDYCQYPHPLNYPLNPPFDRGDVVYMSVFACIPTFGIALLSLARLLDDCDTRNIRRRRVGTVDYISISGILSDLIAIAVGIVAGVYSAEHFKQQAIEKSGFSEINPNETDFYNAAGTCIAFLIMAVASWLVYGAFLGAKNAAQSCVEHFDPKPKLTCFRGATRSQNSTSQRAAPEPPVEEEHPIPTRLDLAKV